MRRLPYLISKPAILLLLAVPIHIGGRMAAFCSPNKADSFIYTIAAYRFWQPDATAADLVPDKPAGQALLTGWVYHIWPWPPSRLAMIPVESAFMLAGYAMFFALGTRLFGRQVDLCPVRHRPIGGGPAGLGAVDEVLLGPTVSVLRVGVAHDRAGLRRERCRADVADAEQVAEGEVRADRAVAVDARPVPEHE